MGQAGLFGTTVTELIGEDLPAPSSGERFGLEFEVLILGGHPSGAD
ncbi:hypothetical protein ACPOL_4719 [Acidisarcina polymorpha]|uniref:Uncharacterized protein n=1 Tax=Acidisarcina polymorpha TaxID=2211140 RepID=A0A2Z5G5C3_9BACT|nr:hypothetical protein ACPOL_4719 [Acidisarcina polymorpha]